jgi:hypothetical protein
LAAPVTLAWEIAADDAMRHVVRETVEKPPVSSRLNILDDAE